MSELVSAVVTTYKREPDMLLRAVTSILNQTYKNIEIIVVDDSPSEYTFRKDISVIINQMKIEGINIQYIQHETNMGACVARNTGLLASNGSYIAFLDDDDEWMPEKIEKQVNVIKNKDVALVYCGCVYKNDVTGTTTFKKRKYLRGNVFDELLFVNFIESTSFPLIKTDCLRAVGGFDSLMQSAQDYDVWLRIAKNHKIDYVQEELVIYHEHNGEQISTNPIKKINGLERINEKYKSFLDCNRILWWKRHIVITPFYAMNGEKGKAIRVWIKCIIKNPANIFENLFYLRTIICKKGI